MTKVHLLYQDSSNALRDGSSLHSVSKDMDSATTLSTRHYNDHDVKAGILQDADQSQQ